MTRNCLFKILLLTFVFLSVSGLYSCHKNDPGEEKDNTYYISSQLLKTRTQLEISAFYTLLGISYLPALNLVPYVNADVKINKIVYKTEYLDGEINASGLVCLPEVAGEYPILCFQNGTNTLHSDAPSVNYNNELFVLIECIASMGFIVLIPDYPGFGESEDIDHPYMHKETTVSSILNMIRASKEFAEKEDTSAQPTDDLFIFGYSQGGWATLALQEAIEQNYSSEFNLIASACGAGPYNLTSVNDYVLSLTEYPQPYYLAYMLKGLKSVGSITNEYSDIFNSEYASEIDQLFDGNHSGSEINAELTTDINKLFTSAYLIGYKTDEQYASVRTAFKDNSISAWNVSTPTRLYHGDQDEYIPISITEEMLSEFWNAGTPESKLEMVTISGYDHSGGVIPTGVKAISWFLNFTSSGD